MSNSEILEKNYVQQREFDIYIQNIKERADSDKELTAARFDKFEAVLDKKISNIEKEVAEVRGDLKAIDEKLSTAIAGLVDRFDDMKEHQNKWFTLFGILFTAAAIIAPVAVALIFLLVTSILSPVGCDDGVVHV